MMEYRFFCLFVFPIPFSRLSFPFSQFSKLPHDRCDHLSRMTHISDNKLVTQWISFDQIRVAPTSWLLKYPFFARRYYRPTARCGKRNARTDSKRKSAMIVALRMCYRRNHKSFQQSNYIFIPYKLFTGMVGMCVFCRRDDCASPRRVVHVPLTSLCEVPNTHQAFPRHVGGTRLTATFMIYKLIHCK